MEDGIVRAQCELVAQQLFLPTFPSSVLPSSPSSAHLPSDLSAYKTPLLPKSSHSGIVEPVGPSSSSASVENFLKYSASAMSDGAITLYRLCRHRAIPIALSHGAGSGHGLNRADGNTTLQDAAFCVCARLIAQLPLVWAAFTRRAGILRPRNPTLWFGKLVLVPVGVSDIEKFAARSHHLMLSRALLFREHPTERHHDGRGDADGRNPPLASAFLPGVGGGPTADIPASDFATSAGVEAHSASALSRAAPLKKTASAAPTAEELSIDPTQVECLAACYFFTVTTPALRKKYPQVVEVGPLNSEGYGGRIPGRSGSAGGAKKRAHAGRDGEIKESLPFFVDGTLSNRFTSNACEMRATSRKNGELGLQLPIEDVLQDENSEGDHELGRDLESDVIRGRLLAESFLARPTKKRRLTRAGTTGPFYSAMHSTKVNGKAETNSNNNDDEIDDDEEDKDDNVEEENLIEENAERQKWNKLFGLLMRADDPEHQNGEASNGQKAEPASLKHVIRASALSGTVDRALNLTELAAQAHFTAFIIRKKRIEALLRRPLIYGFQVGHDLYSSIHDAQVVRSDVFNRSGLHTSSSSSAPTSLPNIRLSIGEPEGQTIPVVDLKEKFNVNDVSSCLHPARVRSFWNPSLSSSSTSTFMLPSLMPRPVSLITCDYLWTRLLICATWLTVYVDVLLPRLASMDKKKDMPTSLNPERFDDSKSLSEVTSGTTIHEENNIHNIQITNKNASSGTTEIIPDRDPSGAHAMETERCARDAHLMHASACIAVCARIIKAERVKYGDGSEGGSSPGGRGSPRSCPVCDEELHNNTHVKFTWSALREDREVLWRRINAFVEVMRAEGYLSPSDSSNEEDEAETQKAGKNGGLETEASQQQDSTSIAHHVTSANHRISLRRWWNVFVGATSAREVVESTLRYCSSPSSKIPAPLPSLKCVGRVEVVGTGFNEMDARGQDARTLQCEVQTNSSTLSYTNEEIVTVQNCFFKAMTHRLHAIVEEFCTISHLSGKEFNTEEILARNSSRNKLRDFPTSFPHSMEGKDGCVSYPQLASPKSSCFGTKPKIALWNALWEKYSWLHRESGPRMTSLNKPYASKNQSEVSGDTVLRPFSSPRANGEKIKDYLQSRTLHQLVLEVVLGGCSVENVAPLFFPFLRSYQKSDVKEHRKMEPLPENYRVQQEQILELLDFIPSFLPALQEEDGVLECAQCLTLFHQHCVGPFQRDFFMGYFLCHTCRLLLSQNLH